MMDPQQVSSYFDKRLLEEQIEAITKDEKFQELKGIKQAEFLYKNLVERIIKYKPFKEGARELFNTNLESIVGKDERSYLKKFFKISNYNPETKVQEYREEQETVGGLLREIGKNQQFYSEISPELLSSAIELQKGYSLSSVAEILYSGKNY